MFMVVVTAVTVVTAKNIYGALQFAGVVLCVIRDQKAAGSNPATSTLAESLVFQRTQGFFFFPRMGKNRGKSAKNWERAANKKAGTH